MTFFVYFTRTIFEMIADDAIRVSLSASAHWLPDLHII